MNSRRAIVRPSELIEWCDIMKYLQGISYDALLELISPNEAAIEFAARFGLIANSRICVRCTQPMFIWSRSGLDGMQWRCMHMVPGKGRGERRRGYCSSRSIRHGSIFNGHHLSIADILEFMYMWARNYALHEIRSHTSFSSEMSVVWAGFMRELAASFVKAHQVTLGGPSVVIELGRLRLQKTKKNEKTEPCILGILERDSQNCLIEMIHNEEDLHSVVAKWILPGSIVVSDLWASDAGRLDFNQLGCTCLVASPNSERLEVIGDQQINVNHCALDELCTQAGAKFLAMNGTSKSNFESYIYEFLFRRIFGEGDLFAALVLWAPILHTS